MSAARSVTRGDFTALADASLKTVTAIEPNDAMRQRGENDSSNYSIEWHSGTGEKTGLGDQFCDLVTMASSFHWVDFDLALDEFRRLLRPGGWFVALWVTRKTEVNPVLVEVEDVLHSIAPNLNRVSSGRGNFVESLSDRFWRRPGFDEIVHIESRHVEFQDLDTYIGAWRSVNDIQSQLGPDKFEQFLDRATAIISKAGGKVEATYLTRAWGVRRVP